MTETNPAVLAIWDQVEASGDTFARHLEQTGITTRHIDDAGPIIAAVVKAMHLNVVDGFEVCEHIITDRTTPAVWYLTLPRLWACITCHGKAPRPVWCANCDADLDTSHDHTVYLPPPPVTATAAVNPPLLVVVTLCSRCSAANDDSGDLDPAS